MQDLLSHLKTFGAASPAKFLVQIPTPFPLPETAFNNGFIKWANQTNRNRYLELLCETAQFPSLNITSTDYTINGIPRHAPYGSASDNITLSFRLSGDMYEKMAFDAWIMSIVDQKHSQIAYATQNGQSYKRNITIHQLKQYNPKANDGVESSGESTSSNAVRAPASLTGAGLLIDSSKFESVYHVTLIDAFPTSVTSLELGASQQNDYHKVMVTFSFAYWKPFGLDTYTEFQPTPDGVVLASANKKPSDMDANPPFNLPPVAGESKVSKIAGLMEKAKGIMKIVKGLLGQDQGLALDIFNKINEFVENATGLRIDEFRVFVEEMDRDIRNIETGVGMSSSSQSALLFGCAALLALLGKPPTPF